MKSAIRGQVDNPVEIYMQCTVYTYMQRSTCILIGQLIKNIRLKLTKPSWKLTEAISGNFCVRKLKGLIYSKYDAPNFNFDFSFRRFPGRSGDQRRKCCSDEITDIS